MSPLRIFVLAVLLYIGFRLIFGGRRKEKKIPRRGEKDAAGNGPLSDVLIEDPVCHCLVPKQQAIHLEHNGSMVYFCSEKCCDQFLAQNRKKGESE